MFILCGDQIFIFMWKVTPFPFQAADILAKEGINAEVNFTQLRIPMFSPASFFSTLDLKADSHDLLNLKLVLTVLVYTGYKSAFN